MRSRSIARAAAVALALASTAACGGIPIWPAPAESHSATPSAVAAPATSSSEAPAAASPSVAPPTPASTRAGVAVIAIGPITFAVDDTGAKKVTEGRDLFSATRSLAKQLYGVPRLRPHADEATVSVLSGGLADPGDPPALRELADLRRALSSDLDGAASRALLESLGRKVDVEGLVLVSASSVGTSARLVRVVPAADGAVSTHLEGATFLATEGPPATAGEGPSYSWDATSIASLLGSPPASARAPTPPLLGPRRDTRVATQPAAPGKPKAKTKKDDKGGKTIFESPWFWVAAGGVAAIGVTALVISQTVDTHSGNVHLQGKVLP